MDEVMTTHTHTHTHKCGYSYTHGVRWRLITHQTGVNRLWRIRLVSHVKTRDYHCVSAQSGRNETRGLTSTETIKAYEGQGGWGVGKFMSNIYPLHCHHQNDSALRWAVVSAILMFHYFRHCRLAGPNMQNTDKCHERLDAYRALCDAFLPATWTRKSRVEHQRGRLCAAGE